MYKGTSGSTQGEKKLRIPCKNTIMAGTPAPEAKPISKPLFHDVFIFFTKCNFKHYSFYFVIINVTDGFVKKFKENNLNLFIEVSDGL